MNWHIDNAMIIKNKKENKSLTGYELSNKYTLQYFIKKPVLTLIVYESDYNIDFTGGILEFIDGETVKPYRGTYILFDSNEAHKVSKILSGVRNNYLVKFYKKC
jgi:hypothetical protein